MSNSNLGSAGLLNYHGKISFEIKQDHQELKFQSKTLHNWVQRIYEFFKFDIPLGDKDVVILGIRDVAAAPKENHDKILLTTEDNIDVITQKRDSERLGEKKEYEMHYSKKNNMSHPMDKTTTYNDILIFAYRSQDKDKKFIARAHVFLCTIDPAGREADATGTPYLLEGKLYYVTPGKHDGKDAGRIFSEVVFEKKEQFFQIRLLREATDLSRIFFRAESALVKSSSGNHTKTWEFCAMERNDTIHMHHGYGSHKLGGPVGSISTGCTAMAYEYNESPSSPYGTYLHLIENAGNKAAIPFLIVSSSYVVSFEKWKESRSYDDVIVNKAVLSPVWSFLRLFSISYLPSIVDTKFYSEVIELIVELDKIITADKHLNMAVTPVLQRIINEPKELQSQRYLPKAISSYAEGNYDEDIKAGLRELSSSLASSISQISFTI